MHNENNNTFIDHAEDLDIAMSMYNLLEYSDNYSMTPGPLWNYHRYKVNDDPSENDAANYRIFKNKSTKKQIFWV